MRFNAVIVILLSACLLVGCAEPAPQPTDLLLANGTVIDLETGELQAQDIYISEGKIVSLTPHKAGYSEGALDTLDMSGKFILPGFWDNHVHFRGGDSLIEANKEFLKLFIANGITTVRDAGGDLTPSVMNWKKAIENETMLGPTIFTAGPKIDGVKPTWAGSIEVGSTEGIESALDSLEQIPVDFVKLYDSTISSEVYVETIQEAEKRDLITSGHMPFSITLEEGVTAGLDGIEHLYYVLKGCSSEETEITRQIAQGELSFWNSMERLIQTKTPQASDKTYHLLRTHDTYVIPTLHIGHVLSYLDEEDHSRDPYLTRMTPAFIATYEGRIQRAANATPEARENRKQMDSLFVQLTNDLNEEGIPLLAGSDSGAYNAYVYPGVSLHRELYALVQAGLTPLEALRTSAYNGARFLRKDSTTGSLEEGFPSDIVILNANPLLNIRNTENIYRVIKGTQVSSPQELLRRSKGSNSVAGNVSGNKK